MDLFHAITQGLENVLTCHWYDELKNFNNSDGTNTGPGNNDNNNDNTDSMSGNDKLMDTEAGGEQTQYEGAVTENFPAEKQRGQLGGAGSNSQEPDGSVSQDRAEKTTDNIRYGQNISESGVGGMTTTSTGHASQGGYGGADEDKDQSKTSQTRREQGYGPGNNVGA